jgi:hypothetical protein
MQQYRYISLCIVIGIINSFITCKQEPSAEILLQKNIPLSKGKTYSPAAAKLTLDILLETMFKPSEKPFLDARTFQQPPARKQFYEYYETYKNLKKLEEQEFESLVSRDYKELNKFFAKRGYNIRFQPFGPQEVGAATDITIKLEKLIPGSNATMTYQKQQYPAAKFSLRPYEHTGKEQKSIELFTTPEHPEPIFTIRSKQQKYIEVITAQTEPQFKNSALENFALFEKLLKNTKLETTARYHYLLMPKFICNDESHLQFLVGASVKAQQGPTLTIAQAIQQIKIIFTEKESIAKIGTGISGVRSAAPAPTYVMDKPFHYMILYFEQEVPDNKDLLKKGIPVLYASITPQEWDNYMHSLESGK